MKLVEKEKNALEAEKDTAVEFLTLENDFFLHKNQLCQYRVWVYQSSTSDQQHDVTQIQTTYNVSLFSGQDQNTFDFKWDSSTAHSCFSVSFGISNDLQKQVMAKEQEKQKILEDTKELTEKNAKISEEMEKKNQELKNVEK